MCFQWKGWGKHSVLFSKSQFRTERLSITFKHKDFGIPETVDLANPN